MRIITLLALCFLMSCASVPKKQARLKAKFEGKKPKEGKNLLPVYGIGLIGLYIYTNLSDDD